MDLSDLGKVLDTQSDTSSDEATSVNKRLSRTYPSYHSFPSDSIGKTKGIDGKTSWSSQNLTKTSSRRFPELVRRKSSAGSISPERRNSYELALLHRDRIADWMICFVVVEFDLEIGQTLDYTYPPTVLSEEEKNAICFSSFPDSNTSMLEEDTPFAFRMTSHSRIQNSNEQEFIYGFTVFRQKKDALVRRGYLQKSLVLLSKLAYGGLFFHMMQLISPTFFLIGKPALESACQNISQWPFPEPGKTYELPLMGTVLIAEIPTSLFPQITSDPKPNSILTEKLIFASVIDNALYLSFHGLLDELWTLWELVLLGEPIVVKSLIPQSCSKAVFVLVDLITPLTYGGDFRPYCTIHDADLAKVFSIESMSAKILGITNPIFERMVEGWPHHVLLGRWQERLSPSLNHLTPVKSIARHGISNHASMLISRHKRIVARDKKLLTTLGHSRPHLPLSECNRILRDHFIMLTKNFMYPFERYFSRLLPYDKDISPFKPCPKIGAFQQESFLEFVSETKPRIPIRHSHLKDWIGLYKGFLKSPNFTLWLLDKQKNAQGYLKKRYIEVLSHADFDDWFTQTNPSPSEIEEIISSIRTELTPSITPFPDSCQEQLHVQMNLLLTKLSCS